MRSSLTVAPAHEVPHLSGGHWNGALSLRGPREFHSLCESCKERRSCLRKLKVKRWTWQEDCFYIAVERKCAILTLKKLVKQGRARQPSKLSPLRLANGIFLISHTFVPPAAMASTWGQGRRGETTDLPVCEPSREKTGWGTLRAALYRLQGDQST